MAVPTRPVAGAPIESAWGDVVHDTAVAVDIQSGKVGLTMANNAVGPQVAVVFPRPFAAPPIVVGTVAEASTSAINYNVGVLGVTTTGVTLNVREVKEAATTLAMQIYWVAIGPRA